ncbi:MAG: hypothetical protein ACRD0J_15720 [Acidimicrobiales bacterium]
MTDSQSGRPTPARMRVVALRDPVVEAHGHRLGSAYVEHVYLGLLGPSATWSPEAVSASSTQAVGL